MNEALSVPLRTLLIGAAGAALAMAGGLPAAALIGSSLAVSLAAWRGMRVIVPRRLRDLAFAAIGVSLGTGIAPTILHDLAAWGISLALLCLSLVATLLAAVLILRRVFRFDLFTSVLAASPGTMSYAVAVAQEGRGDPVVVLVLQSLRLLLLASVLPILVFTVAPPGAAAHPLTMGIGASAFLVVAAMALGIPLARIGLPAAALVAGMTLSGLGHASGLVAGRLPPWAISASFVIAGSVVGARFSGISARAIVGLVGAAALTTGTAALMSGAFALLVSTLVDLPLGQVWIAFAPGGVEAMAAIGLALGYDPAYVAVHHLVRIVFLIFTLPLVLRDRRPARTDRQSRG